MKKFNELITLCMVSFHSDKIIKKILKTIPLKYKVIVTDNALSKDLKSVLESSFKNVEVIIPSSNLGNGGGINFALNKVSTKYALYLDVDTVLEEDTIDRLIKIANSESNWGIIAPNLKNFYYKENCYLKKYVSQEISHMKFIEGCALLLNMKEFNIIGFYDEKIFLYFEENDLFFRCLKNDKNIILCHNINIEHLGNASVDDKYSLEIELNRNWHYMWSKFYYYKKNYSYLRGLKETLTQFIKASIKLVFYYFTNKDKFLIYRSRASGLFNSYLNKTSWKRPYIR
jgi:N-acetylglucosaminyl-diphospho-decaprenol L-rhamnosyltransferase